MSNLLNSFYSNLNDLISINATDITTDTLTSNSINTTTLKVNGSNINNLFDASYAYIEGQITSTNTTLTTCSYDSATQTFVVGNNLKCLGTFTLYVSGVYYNVNTFITTTNNDIQTNISNISTNSNNITNNTADIQTIKTTLTNVSYNNAYNAFQIGGTTDCRILNALYLYSSGTPYSVNTFVVNTNTSISSLVNKTTDISYSSGLTTIEKLSFNTFINGFAKANFDNAINFTYDLSSNAQTQINGAYAAAGTAGAAAAAAGVAVAAVAADLVLTNAALVLTDANVATNTADIDTLEGKLSTYTYDVANNVVAIGSRLNANSFGGITFNGSLNQNSVNARNDLYGNTYYHNHLRSADGAAIFAQDVDLTGNLTVGGTATITGATTLNGGLTASGTTTNLNSTTTQVGTTSASTLNTYSTANFYGPTTIRNNSTTSSGTIAPYLNVLSIATNANARKLQGITIGAEQILNNQSNCNIGYNYVSDGSTSNYGYLGLNTNTLNTLESLRWSSTKVLVQTGNFEVANNASVLGNSSVFGSFTTNTIQNTGVANSAPLAITTTGTNNNIVITSAANTNLFGTAVKLNSNDVQIGSNQGAGVNNTVLIGSTTSNTTTNIPNGIKTNTLSPFNTGNAVNINGLNLNLATSEATSSNNVITLGSINALTTTNVPYLFKTNSISGYNTATALSLNNGVINIGYNQGIAANNTVNIGAITSNTNVNINGILTINYNLGSINVNSVLSQFV